MGICVFCGDPSLYDYELGKGVCSKHKKDYGRFWTIDIPEEME